MVAVLATILPFAYVAYTSFILPFIQGANHDLPLPVGVARPMTVHVFDTKAVTS